MIDALTDELLANAERLYLMAVARGEGIPGGYHGEGGVPGGVVEQGLSAEEKKWLT
jgi:hypothetical protein